MTRGALRLLGARVGGQLDLGDAELTNESGPAVGADRLRAGGLYGTGVTVRGAITLRGARIDGQVNLGDAVLADGRGSALSADGMRVEGGVHAVGLRATGSGEFGVLCLIGASVGGNVHLDDAELTNDTGAAFSGDRLRIEGNLYAEDLTATGAFRLLGARIDGQAKFTGARFASGSGPAWYADGLRVGDLHLTGVRASGAGDEGAIRVHGAEVTGQVLVGGAEITNAAGPAFSADETRVGTSLDLGGLKATCTSEIGAVSLFGARVDGRLGFDSAELTNTAGPALSASRCQVRETFALIGVRATGAGEQAVVELLGARVGGQLSFTGASVVHPAGGTLVSLEDVVVEGPVFFPAELAGTGGLVHLEGFRFGALADVTWREWLDLIRNHTAGYRPGPYQRLAAAERAAGHDGNVRHVLITQQRDLRRRAPEAVGGRLARWFHWLWGAFAGYGYRARRTAAALVFAVVAAGLLGLWAGHVSEGGHRAAERTSELTAKAGTPCTTVELVGVGLDRGLPLSPGVRGRCDLNTGIGSGQVFTVAIWLVQAAIWALATLALVGYTGLVRKTG
ncbi:hypothetical protein [Amycolatopsis sp. NBC_00438]|uniref:hypothetical protein n=1 Tax=Amycolatopsis sp. NBC_00438 TaxID=2903558 RepID=UPI002E241BD0